MSGVRTREAVTADVRRIAEIHVLAWQSGYRGLLPQELLDALRPAQRIPRWLGTVRRAAWPRQGTLVADQAGDVVGFADLRPAADDVGEIASFYVLPAMWGKGVGQALMAGSLGTFRTAGYRSARLWVLDTNARAIRFYTKAGWRPDGTCRPDFVGGQRIVDLRYRLDLS